MLVTHLAIGDGGRLQLWAEDSSLPPQRQPTPGRPPNVPDPREHLLDNLRELRGAGEAESSGDGSFQQGDARPIGDCLDAFWTGEESADAIQFRSESVEMADATLRRLGEPPAGLEDVQETVAEYYSEMTR